jgi:NadR type nicotinamide-nucleotide adenylyltransferase
MPHFRPMDTGNSPKVRRVAIVGPECTGKTDLARFLANHYQTTWVPEFARVYLEELHRPYTKEDLTIIARGQLKTEKSIAKQANQFIFCDTNLVVIKIWSEFKYGSCNPEILTLMNQQKYDLHLLTDVDLPWEDDPLREHPHKRQELFDLYKAELENTQTRFTIIRGDYALRRASAVEAVEKIK